MIDAETVEKAFKADLRALLKRYNAEIQAEDHYPGYAECGEDIRMTVSIPAEWEAGELRRERAEFSLGNFVDNSTQ